MEKIEYRAYIKTRSLLGIPATDITNELLQVYGVNAPQYRTVAKWAALFKAGRETLEDDHRSGRPITVHTASNIELVKSIIQHDPHATFDEIVAESSINRYTVGEIINSSLKYKKLASRWIPHELTEKNRQERVEACQENLAKFKEGKWRLCDVITGDESWFYLRQIGHKSSNASWVAEGESPRTVVRRDRYEPKSMYSIFFKTTGLVHIDVLDKSSTITSNYYIENCLEPIKKELNKQRPLSGTTSMKFHHDNARPHVTKKVKSYLNEAGFTIIRHPPYSPDLAPSDFWLFDKIKTHLDNHADTNNQKRQITKILQDIPKEEYKKTFDKWLERMQLCIDNKGEYFEHLIK
jgi:histone-lysine N-methyltransferase SETMAR